MPGYIKPYESQDVANAPGQFSTDLPQVTDIGPTISSVGEELQRDAAPYLRDRAEQQAIEDAGAASIVKTPEGGYARANTTKGGGLIYARAYSQALDTRQLNVMSEDYATQLQLVAQQASDDPSSPMYRDPHKFWSFASGTANAMLEAAPLSIRAQLDTQLTRELAQSFRGFSQAAMTANHRELVDGLQTSLHSIQTRITKRSMSNADPADIARDNGTDIGLARETVQRLHDVGAIGDVKPYLEDLDAGLFDEGQFVSSMESLQGLSGNLAKMPDTDLQRLYYWGTKGINPDGGKVGEMDFDQFRQLFPSRSVASTAGEAAGSALSDRIRAENARLLAEASAPKPVTVADVEAVHDNLNYLPDSGMTHEQFAAATLDYDSHGPIAEQLRNPDRVQATLGFLASTGTVPKNTDTVLRSMILSSDPEAQQQALNFIWNARDITQPKTGAWSGLKWFNNLPDDVKALATFDGAMRRAGFNTTMELKTIYAKTQGRLPSSGDLMAEFGRQQDYDGAVMKTLADEFRVKPGELGPFAGKMQDDLKRYYAINRPLYATKEQALQASAAMVSTGWAQSPIFVGGFGDKKLVAEGIPTWFMDGVVKNTPALQRAGAAGATFANGRIKIQATGDSPGEHYPHYVFTWFNDQGQQLSSTVFPMQNVVSLWHRALGQHKARMDQEALDAMPPPRWKLEKRPDGRVGYVDNRAEYDAWAKHREGKGDSFDSAKLNEQIRQMGAVRY
jgi:hypothetical protein